MDEDLVKRAAASSDPSGQTKRTKRSAWRHPLKPDIEVPYRVAAVIALMEMGISDYSVIAAALRMTLEEVQRVDSAEDSAIRQLCLERIPDGEYFKLDEEIRCPRCNAMIKVVPCVACSSPPLGSEPGSPPEAQDA